MPFAGVGIAIAVGVAMAIAGADLWPALGVVLVWIGTLWLARPAPAFEGRREGRNALTHDALAPFIEALGAPALLLDRERIVVASKAARAALGSHIVGQDARLALRHPQAIEVLSRETQVPVTIPGLLGTGSVWQVRRVRIGERFSLIELHDRTAEADVSRAHTDFVANASHELRTPLAAIIGYLETLREGGVDEPTRARFMAIMESEAKRMQSLVEDLMSLSRIEAEKHDLPRDGVDMSEVVRSVARDAVALHGTQRLEADLALQPALIAGDRRQLEQLVRNLVDNALKYGAANHPVRISTAEEGGKIALRVADRGPGIAREHLPHLTRRFYRTDPGRSRSAGGTGLGLAIVKHIVERHRGQLDIHSEIGRGTTVTVTIPKLEPVSQ
jgi:two-component system phosphate regulon sensor histidine kinase PhoR